MKCSRAQIEDIISLASNRECKDYSDVGKKDFALVSYLENLDFEQVKDIQAIMLLGREKDFKGTDTFTQRFDSMRSYLDSKGWSTKDNEISYMCEKAPLAQYLRDGLEIVGL